MSPKNIHPLSMTLFGNGVFVNIIRLRRSYWIRVGPKSSGWCPYEKSKDRDTAGRSWEMEAQFGVVQLRTTRSQGRGLRFLLMCLTAGTGRQYISVKPSSLWSIVTATLGNWYGFI